MPFTVVSKVGVQLLGQLHGSIRSRRNSRSHCHTPHARADASVDGRRAHRAAVGNGLDPTIDRRGVHFAGGAAHVDAAVDGADIHVDPARYAHGELDFSVALIVVAIAPLRGVVAVLVAGRLTPDAQTNRFLVRAVALYPRSGRCRVAAPVA